MFSQQLAFLVVCGGTTTTTTGSWGGTYTTGDVGNEITHVHTIQGLGEQRCQ